MHTVPKTLFSSKSLFYLFIFLLPLQTRWIFFNTDIVFQEMALYAFDIVLLVLYALQILKIFNNKFLIKRKNQKSEIPKNSYASGFGTGKNLKSLHRLLITLSYLLIIWSLLSTAWSPHTNLTLYWSLRLLAAVSLMWLVNTIRPNMRTIVSVLVTAITVQALMGIGQFFLQNQFIVSKWLGTAAQHAWQLGAPVIETDGGRYMRALGTQPHPNVFGGLMVIGILLTHYVLSTLTFKKKYIIFIFKRLLLITSYLLLITGLFVSFSRSAWLAMVSIAGVWLMYSLTRNALTPLKAVHITVLASLVLVATFAGIYKPLITTRITANTRLEQKSIHTREITTTLATYFIQANPVYGTSNGNYTTILKQSFPFLTVYSIEPVHNIYLLITAELGIVGILLFVTVIIITFYFLLSTFYSHNTQKNYHITQSQSTFLAILAALLIVGLFDHYLWTLPTTFFLLWTTIALIYTKKDSYKQLSK